MKKFLKIIAGLAVFFVLAFTVVIYLTADMVEAVDEFFVAASQGDEDGAYNLLAQEFQAGTSKEELMVFLNSLQIQDLDVIEWGERSISGGQGSIAGTLKLKGGGSVPLTVDMVSEDDGWRIYTISKAPSGIQDVPMAYEMPPEEEVVRLVNQSTIAFAESVQADSMEQFLGHISALWQSQTNAAELDEIFGAFFELESDFRILANYPPVFHKAPEIDERGVLVVRGHYPTTPDKFYFRQSYIYEGVGWKLFGFSASIGEQDAQ